MTKIRAYEPSTPKPEVEQTVFLRLKNVGEHVQLEAVKEDGSHAGCGNLMKFWPDGTFQVIEAGEVGGKDFRSKY